MSKKKIALLSGYFDPFSGYWEVVMARELARMGHPVLVLASDRAHLIFSDEVLRSRGFSRRYAEATLQEGNLTVMRFAPKGEWRAMVRPPDLSPALEKFRPDFIVAYNPGSLWCAGALPYVRATGVPLAAYFPDNSAQYANLGALSRLAKRTVFFATKGWTYRRVARAAQRRYFSTPEGMQALQPLMPAGRPCEVMPLGFAGDIFFADQTLREKVRASLGWTAETPVIVTAGKIHPEKRLSWLLDAMLEVPTAARLLIVGTADNEESRSLEARVQNDPRLSQRVHFRPFGSQADLNAYFNAADIGVWPRQPAITIQQSMASGLFVLLPRNPYVGHLLKEDAGTYFTAEAPATMVAALKVAVESQLADIREKRALRTGRNQWLSQGSICRDFLAENQLI